jgi:hypothetical protein
MLIALGRVPDAELDHVVRKQHRDQAREQEREPDGGPGNDCRLSEKREDPRSDHRADADKGGAADAHLKGMVERRIGSLDAEHRDTNA